MAKSVKRVPRPTELASLRRRLKEAEDALQASKTLERDMAERQQVEHALRDSEERYRDLVQFAPTGIYEVDFATGRFINVNDAMCRIMGYTRDEFLAMSAFDILDDEGKARFAARVRMAQAGERPQGTVEYPVRTKDGRLIWALINATFHWEGDRIVGATVVAHDITERKRVEESLREAMHALRESEEKYKSLVKFAPTAIYEIDVLGTQFISVNDAMCDILMYTREELLPMRPTDLMDSYSRALFQERVRKGMAGEKVDTTTSYRVQRKDGNWLDVEINVGTITVTDGKPSRIVVIGHNVTERKKIERALRQSEERYRDLVESSNSIIMRADENFNITYINEFGLKYFGYTAEELIGKNVVGTTIPERDNEGNDLVAMIRDIPKNPIKYRTNVHQNMRKGGELVWVSWTNKVNYDRDGKLVDILAVGNDINRMKKAEAAMRESEERFRIMADNSPVIIWVTDADGGNQFVNRMFCDYFGVTHDQAEGQKWQPLVHPEDAPAYVADFFRAVRDHTTFKAQARMKRADGEWRWIESYAEPRRSPTGEFLGHVGLGSDITERKQAEQQIAKLNRDLEVHAVQLEVANRELESFSYSVSHDLRTPLVGISTFASLLLDEYGEQLPREAQHYAELIRKNVVEMNQLIEGLLAFSRFTRQPLKKQPVDMNALVKEVFETLAPQQAGRQVELVLGDLPACQADPVLLKQVLTNLLSNALKFTRQREVARIEVGSSTWDQGELVYFVRDNGVGFENAQAEKLFGVFQRLHHDEDYEGTGVGLAIVERIIHRHGGRVCAEAEVDKGATFYFSLG